jgi:hypothetical protein
VHLDGAVSLAGILCLPDGQGNQVKILATAKAELQKHSLGTFVVNPPSVAEGGQGVVVTGCPACLKRFGTVNQLMRHLADDVLPVILRQAFAIASET